MEQTKATLNAIRECLAKNMPPHGKAMLFGSQARGTARADSDWDIFRRNFAPERQSNG